MSRKNGRTNIKGQFDQGWDTLREETFARQKALGVIPESAELTVRSPGIPAWDEMDPILHPVLAREAEVYAGFLEYADHHVGRLIDAVEDLGILDDTLVYLIIGDNGASAEGNFQGTTNEYLTINHALALETPEYMVEHMDKLGTPDTYNHYAIGWAHAMDTPTSGPSRSAPTGAAPATAPSSTGRTGSNRRARSVTSSPMSSMSQPRCWKRPGYPRPRW